MKLTNSDLGDALSFGFNNTKQTFLTWVITFVVIFVISIVLSSANSAFTTMVKSFSDNILAVVIIYTLIIMIAIASYVFQYLVALGLVRMGLKIFEKKPASYKDIFAEKKLAITYFLASLVIACILLLCLIPALIAFGLAYAFSFTSNPIFFVLMIILALITLIAIIYLQTAYTFFYYFIVDKHASIGESLTESWRITKGVKWKLILFFILCGLVNLVGVLLFIVGILFTYPMTLLAGVFIYKKLSSGTPSTPTPAAPPPVETPLVVHTPAA